MTPSGHLFDRLPVEVALTVRICSVSNAVLDLACLVSAIVERHIGGT